MSDYQAVIEQVTLYLGAPWKFNHLFETGYNHYEIIDGCGRGLLFIKDWNNPRFRIRGVFSPAITSPYMRSGPTISVSAERNPKAIAADIKRRFLPGYLETFTKSKQAREQENAAAAELQIIIDAVIKVTGGYETDRGGSARRMVYFTGGSVELFSNQSATLRLTGITAERAITLLAKHHAPKI